MMEPDPDPGRLTPMATIAPTRLGPPTTAGG